VILLNFHPEYSKTKNTYLHSWLVQTQLNMYTI